MRRCLSPPRPAPAIRRPRRLRSCQRSSRRSSRKKRRIAMPATTATSSQCSYPAVDLEHERAVIEAGVATGDSALALLSCGARGPSASTPRGRATHRPAAGSRAQTRPSRHVERRPHRWGPARESCCAPFARGRKPLACRRREARRDDVGPHAAPSPFVAAGTAEARRQRSAADDRAGGRRCGGRPRNRRADLGLPEPCERTAAADREQRSVAHRLRRWLRRRRRRPRRRQRRPASTPTRAPSPSPAPSPSVHRPLPPRPRRCAARRDADRHPGRAVLHRYRRWFRSCDPRRQRRSPHRRRRSLKRRRHPSRSPMRPRASCGAI